MELNRCLTILLAMPLIILLLNPSSSHAQAVESPLLLEPSPSPSTTSSDDHLPNDLLGLADLRGSLNAEIASLQRRIDDLDNQSLEKVKKIKNGWLT